MLLQGTYNGKLVPELRNRYRKMLSSSWSMMLILGLPSAYYVITPFSALN